MTKPLTFRDRKAEQQAVDDANAHMEMMFGDLRRDKGIAAPAARYVPKTRMPRGGGDPRNATDIDAVHRTRKAEQADRPLESVIINAVEELLRVHPRVLWALRMNAGAASYATKTGKFAPVWFHRWVRAPERVRMSDFYGVVASGQQEFGWNVVGDGTYVHRPVILAIECKRPGWSKPTDDREREQAAFLALVRKHGGIGIFCTDPQQVAEALR